MNLYSFKFKGHYPVGTAGLVVAEDLDMAVIWAEKKLKEIGLEQKLSKDDFKLQDTSSRRVDILLDGDY